VTKKRIHAPNGIITFRSDAVEVEEHQFKDEPTIVKLDILRCNGSEGTISCKLQTEGLSAVPGKDFEEMDETIEFEDGETEKEVELCIFPQRPLEPDDVLQLVLSEAEGDAFFNPNDDGGKAIGLLTVTIKNSEAPSLMERLVDRDNFVAGLEVWKQQILASWKPEQKMERNHLSGSQRTTYSSFWVCPSTSFSPSSARLLCGLADSSFSPSHSLGWRWSQL